MHGCVIIWLACSMRVWMVHNDITGCKGCTDCVFCVWWQEEGVMAYGPGLARYKIGQCLSPALLSEYA